MEHSTTLSSISRKIGLYTRLNKVPKLFVDIRNMDKLPTKTYHWKKIFPLFFILVTIPLWTGCTNKFVSVKGTATQEKKLEAKAVQGWDKPSKMRELKPSSIEVVDLGLSKVSNNADPHFVGERDAVAQSNHSTGRAEQRSCPSGTVPFLSTIEGQKIVRKSIRASGYGAPPARILSTMQKRLLALRAAKLDAVRALGERVSGVEIWGGSTLSDLVLNSDKVHVELDSFNQGARVISTLEREDGSFEAVMGINFNSAIVSKLELNRCVPGEGNPMKMQFSNMPLASVL